MSPSRAARDKRDEYNSGLGYLHYRIISFWKIRFSTNQRHLSFTSIIGLPIKSVCACEKWKKTDLRKNRFCPILLTFKHQKTFSENLSLDFNCYITALDGGIVTSRGPTKHQLSSGSASTSRKKRRNRSEKGKPFKVPFPGEQQGVKAQLAFS
jgi:hypothetical protein